MSLINKMLKDLEARQNAPLGKPPARPIFQDLHAVTHGGLPRRLLPGLLLAVFVLALGAAAYVWIHRITPPPARTDIEATRKPAAVDSPVTAPAEAAVAPPPHDTSAITSPVSVAAALVTALPTPMVTPVMPNPAPAVVTAVKPPEPGTSATRIKPPIASHTPPPTAVPTARPVSRATLATPDAAVRDEAPGSIEKKNIPLTLEQNAENTYRAAALQMQQRHLDEAERDFVSALAINPRHLAARELLAGLLLERARMHEAQVLLEEGLTVVPGQASFATLLARIYVEQNDENKAITLLEQQRNSAKPTPDTLALLATLYQRAARHAEAIAAFKDALTLRPLEGKWWLGLGISQEAEQNWNEARFAYERVRTTNVEPRLARYAEQRLAIVRTK